MTRQIARSGDIPRSVRRLGPSIADLEAEIARHEADAEVCGERALDARDRLDAIGQSAVSALRHGTRHASVPEHEIESLDAYQELMRKRQILCLMRAGEARRRLRAAIPVTPIVRTVATPRRAPMRTMRQRSRRTRTVKKIAASSSGGDADDSNGDRSRASRSSTGGAA